MTIETTAPFRRDLKRAEKRGLPTNELWTVVEMLKRGEELPPKYRDHALQGSFKGTRECHIRGDWLLVYRVEKNRLVLVLMRTGTHSDIFGNSRRED